MVYGEVKDQLVLTQQLTGKIIPALANQPEIPAELFYIWDAFAVLTRSRQLGFATGPIPLSEIKAYIELFDIFDPSFFIACILALDCKYLAWLKEKRDRESSGK